MIRSAATSAEQVATARHGGRPLVPGVTALRWVAAVMVLAAGLFTFADLGRTHPVRP